MMTKVRGLVLLGGICFALPLTTSAQVVEMVQPENQHSVTSIEDYPTVHAYYGELIGWPHMYELTADESFQLTLSLAEPAIQGVAQEDFGVIIIKQKSRGVEEVVRLRPEDVSWVSEYDASGGDTYYKGSEFNEELEAGTYQIEVSTPDNVGKYVLTVGYEKSSRVLRYFKTLGEIYAVKRFYEKPAVAVVQSPFYYVPLLLLLAGLVVWRRRK